MKIHSGGPNQPVSSRSKKEDKPEVSAHSSERSKGSRESPKDELRAKTSQSLQHIERVLADGKASIGELHQELQPGQVDRLLSALEGGVGVASINHEHVNQRLDSVLSAWTSNPEAAADSFNFIDPDRVNELVAD